MIMSVAIETGQTESRISQVEAIGSEPAQKQRQSHGYFVGISTPDSKDTN